MNASSRSPGPGPSLDPGWDSGLRGLEESICLLNLSHFFSEECCVSMATWCFAIAYAPDGQEHRSCADLCWVGWAQSEKCVIIVRDVH